MSTASHVGVGRYAPTSALTYLICVPLLLALIAAVVLSVSLALDPGRLSAALANIR